MDFKVATPKSHKSTRGYLKLKDIEKHRSFILEKYNAGVRHKHILVALKQERGVTLEIHHLKRSLVRWKAAHKNLTKSRKLFIKNSIQKRHNDENKSPYTVKFKNGREFSQYEIDQIMATTPSYFDDTQPDGTGIILSSPTPKIEEHEPTNNDFMLEDLIDYSLQKQYDEAVEVMGHYVPEYQSEFIADSEIPGGTNEPFTAEEVLGDVEEENIGLIPSESLEHFVLTDSGVNTPFSNMREPEDSMDRLQKLISDNLDMISSAHEELGSLPPEVESQQILDLDPEFPENGESLLQIYARKYEAYFHQETANWEREAAAYMRRADIIICEHPTISLEAVRDMIIEKHGYWDYLPYHIYRQILAGKARHPVINKPLITGARTGDAICEFIEEIFPLLREAVLESVVPQYLRQLNDYVVHLPRIIREYGLYHFYTANALFFSLELIEITWAVSNQKQYELQAYVLDIYYAIGMGCDITVLRVLYSTTYMGVSEYWEFDVTRDAIEGEMVRQYGNYDFRTIFLHACRTLHMLLVQHRHRKSKLMAEKVVHRIENSILTVPDHGRIWIMRSLALLTEVLVTCKRERLAIRLLEQARVWSRDEGSKTIGRVKFPENDISLGEAYSNLNEHEKALNAFFRAFHAYGEEYGYHDASTIGTIGLIIDIMDARGPVLYVSLEPSFRNFFSSFERTGRTKSLIYREFLKAWEKGGINPQKVAEYQDILMLRSSNRERTPDLQEFFYLQGLANWVFAQGESPKGGWVEDLTMDDF
ncbi:hypothetical protein H072_8019 [Dactylellina haptotyla CBS 200.50]|uniref:Clr5 domain-containing protein n=1 Tax=Dactylellina haptotyla (strain CBS 200.50) TaxID=1284197 RepID=S8A5F1_DACHA|nr:hypothetical protein H072_8019 [Dactylellina haptotyla CBS 200.50]